MTYPLINGATINDDDQGATVGIDLARAGPAQIKSALLADGAGPLELGAPAVRVSINPPGMDLVSEGQSFIRYQHFIRPAGTDLVTAGPAGLSVVLRAEGAVALELGEPRVRSGVDVALKAFGIDLVRQGYHSIMLAQPAPNIVLQAASARPLVLGAPSVNSATVVLQAGGAMALQLGMPTSHVSLGASGARPLELGTPAVAFRLRAAGAAPLELGAPTVAGAMRLEGIDLARAGMARMVSGVNALAAAGAWPLELGAPGRHAITLHARQSFPLALGRPSIDRGSAC